MIVISNYLWEIIFAVWVIVSFIWYAIEKKEDPCKYNEFMPSLEWHIFFCCGGIAVVLLNRVL